MKMEDLYEKFAECYDLIYSKKDYRKEINFIESIIRKNKISGKDILEVGCGTGNHTILLKKRGYNIIGLDKSKAMLRKARKKIKTKLLLGDMKNFKLNKKFDIILSLFSVVHYNLNNGQLKKTLKNFYNHLKWGGIIIFDMGFNKERWTDGKVNLINFRNENINGVRLGISRRKNDKAFVGFGYLVYKNKKFISWQEVHKLKLFRTLEVKKILENIGFKVKIYENYTYKPWYNKSKKYVVFVGVKQ